MEKPKSYKIKNPLSKIQAFWYKYILARKIAPTCKNETCKRNSPQHLYAQVCFFRYRTTKNIQNKQFINEIVRTEENQPTGWDAMRVRRLFSITMLYPPMHSKHEIRQTFKNYRNN